MSTNPNLLPVVKTNYGRLQNYVGGKFLEATNAKSLPVIDPATAKTIAEVPVSNKSDVEAAIAAALEVGQEWRETPPQLRVQPLFRLKTLMEENYDEIAKILTQEHGKVIDEARGSVRRAIDNVELACGIPSLLMGESLEDGGAAGIDEESIRQPVGVFAAIAPFNFPAMVPFWFWPTAVACGNTFVLKPSELTPLTQARLVKLIDEAGFPEGVINLVNGDKETADVLLKDPRIAGVSFVGSTPVAKHIYATSAASGKRVQCQGGAKNFIVVMPDANLDACLPNMVASFYGNSGQRCLAGSVLVAVGNVGDELVRRFVDLSAKIRVGCGLDQSAQMGPLTGQRNMDRVLSMIKAGVEGGAKLILDGRKVQVEGFGDGFFVGPTVFDNVKPEMSILRDEIFGPVVAVLRVKTLAEAIEIANRSRFGNAGTIYTSSGKAAREFKYHLRGGNIGINVGVPAPMAFFPFGGMKDSFFGDLHSQGKDGLNFFTDRKVVITRWM